MKYILYVGVLFIATGCGVQIEEFVKNGAILIPKDLINPERPILTVSADSEKAMSLSGASLSFSNSQVQGQVRMNPQKSRQTGTSVDSIMSVNSHRIE